MVFIISSVAGGGKSTLISRVVAKHPQIQFSVSYTTRLPREGDLPGKTYYFVTVEEFERKIRQGFFLEWAKVHDNYYGTPLQPVKDCLASGQIMLMDLDVQGADSIKQLLPDVKTIFILPPSREIWEKRLRSRGTDSPEVIEKRIRNGEAELARAKDFDFQLVNDDLETAVADLEKILQSPGTTSET